MAQGKTAQVHRFRQSVALYAGRGETVYMTAKDARIMARQLYKIARSIEGEEFSKSPPLTLTVPVKQANEA